MDLQEVKDALATLDAPVYVGYAPTGAGLPRVVIRPITVDSLNESLAGSSIGWDLQLGAYCVGGSVEASFNLGVSVMEILQGARVGGVVLSTSMGYSGAQVEGHYESQVTIQSNQGGI